MELKELVGIRITNRHHKSLEQLALQRSYQLGRRVGMGFVVEEMINKRLQNENPEERSTDLFAAHN
jgi:hypothetical protein